MVGGRSIGYVQRTRTVGIILRIRYIVSYGHRGRRGAMPIQPLAKGLYDSPYSPKKGPVWPPQGGGGTFWLTS